MPSLVHRLLAVLFLPVLPAGAGAAGSTGEWTSSISPTLVSASVFRGQQRGRAALQTTLESTAGSFGAGIWTSFPLEGSGALAPGTEADLYVFDALPLRGNITLAPGATLYTYPRAERSAGFSRATFEPSLALNATLGGVRFTPKLYQDLTLKATTLELAAVYALALSSLGTELDWAVTTGTYLRRDDAVGTTASTRAWGNYWQAGVSMPYQITAHIRLIVGWSFAAGTGASVKVAGAARISDARTTSRGFASFGLSSTF